MLLFGLLAGFCVSQLIATGKDKTCLVSQKQIDLPEEIQIASKGDTLIVYAVSEDTIYIGFNPKNK